MEEVSLNAVLASGMLLGPDKLLFYMFIALVTGGMLMAGKGIGQGITQGDGKALVSGVTAGLNSVGTGVGQGVGTAVTGAADGILSVGKGFFSGVKTVGKGFGSAFTGKRDDNRKNPGKR